MSPIQIFFVSALVVMLAAGIVATVFSEKLFRPEATLAIVLTVVIVAGWVWRMPRGWYTMSQIAWRYRLKTCQVREVADELGIRAFNRGALVPPSQRKKMHPELMRLKKRKTVREPRAAKDSRSVYEPSAAQSSFLEEADRMQFSGQELLRHLRPGIAHFDADVEDEAV
ncbi:formate dehydrogenase [Mycobacterium sp. 852002-10029_SCH5224772]|uniref:formate dehydrogenase n=1 Tax=Mycobacterium sp. 852002-10029_SCH5224772 TaxID=1834083 RepID=UPI000A71AF14|nr:formate dehydrogenase [Mycobacterium sp. 852002-10029_SCH5224772]